MGKNYIKINLKCNTTMYYRFLYENSIKLRIKKCVCGGGGGN